MAAMQNLYCMFRIAWKNVVNFNVTHSLETDAASQNKSDESAHTLERTKDELLKQRELLEQKLQEGSLLDPKEERR